MFLNQDTKGPRQNELTESNRFFFKFSMQKLSRIRDKIRGYKDKETATFWLTTNLSQLVKLPGHEDVKTAWRQHPPDNDK